MSTLIDVSAELALIERKPWSEQPASLVDLVEKLRLERDTLAAGSDPDALTIVYLMGRRDARGAA